MEDNLDHYHIYLIKLRETDCHWQTIQRSDQSLHDSTNHTKLIQRQFRQLVQGALARPLTCLYFSSLQLDNQPRTLLEHLLVVKLEGGQQRKPVLRPEAS